MTHGSGQPSQYPYECRGLERKRARTHEQVTNGARGVDDHVCNSFVDDSAGCNHQLGARVGPRLTQIARSRGVYRRFHTHNTHELATWPKSPPIWMHTSVTYSPYELLIAMESPGRVEVTTSTHDSRIMTALSIPLLVQGSPPKASPFSRTSDKWCTCARSSRGDHLDP